MLAKKRCTRVAGLVFMMVLTAGCGAASAPSSPRAQPTAARQKSAASTKLMPVTLRQAWMVTGYSAPFILAKAKGFYKQAGFDVSIPEGKGSITTAETVANGNDAFGFTDAGVAALLISKGAPLDVLAVYLQTTPKTISTQMI